MKVMKTLIGSDDGSIYTLDTIEIGGDLWIVPNWLEAPALGQRKPELIIRLDMPYQKLDGNFGDKDFLVQGSIPKSVLDGKIPPEIAHKYVVEILPEIVLPMPDRTSH
jgi:hypothetical protein